MTRPSRLAAPVTSTVPGSSSLVMFVARKSRESVRRTEFLSCEVTLGGHQRPNKAKQSLPQTVTQPNETMTRSIFARALGNCRSPKQFFKVTGSPPTCACAQSGIKALGPLQNSHTLPVFAENRAFALLP